MSHPTSDASVTSTAPSSLSPRYVFWVVLVAVVLLATNMRSHIVALGSIAPLIQDALGIGETHIGWLGAIPLIMFAFGALISPAIAKRFGVENTLIAALVALTIGIILRAVWVSWLGFFVGTTLLSLAIGFANILFSPIIKQHAPNHIPFLTSVFSLVLAVSAGVAAGTVYPVAQNIGWQWSLGLWASVAILALMAWVVLRIKLGSSKQSIQDMYAQDDASQNVSIWRAPLAWYLAICMGLQSLIFYTVASFLPSIWVSKGLTQAQGGTMGSIFQFMAPPAIIGMTFLIRRGVAVQKVALVAALLNVAGIFGTAYLSPRLALLWSAIMGLGCTVIFTLSMMLFSMRTYTPHQASSLSGMAQTIAYLIAFLGPFGTGWLHEYTHSWDAPLLFVLILTIVNVGVAWMACRPVMIDGRPVT